MSITEDYGFIDGEPTIAEQNKDWYPGQDMTKDQAIALGLVLGASARKAMRKENLPPATGIEKNIISVSGGKDSTALLLLAIERGTENLEAVFADTGHEHAQTYEYVQYLNDHVFPIRTIRADFAARMAKKRQTVLTKWPEFLLSIGMSQTEVDEKVARVAALLVPTGNPFLDLCMWKGRFPSTMARFCSEELKRNPIVNLVQRPYLDAGFDVISWQGVRADESESRANLIENELKLTNENDAELWNFRPILKWTVEDVFAMHRKHGIKPNPLYMQGMGRVGCMPCIHARKNEILEIAKRFPEEIARVAEMERIVSEVSKRGVSTFFAADKTTGEKFEAGDVVPGIWQVVEWSKTSRGGKQFDMFAMLEDEPTAGPLCSSIYGLCE